MAAEDKHPIVEPGSLCDIVIKASRLLGVSMYEERGIGNLVLFHVNGNPPRIRLTKKDHPYVEAPRHLVDWVNAVLKTQHARDPQAALLATGMLRSLVNKYEAEAEDEKRNLERLKKEHETELARKKAAQAETKARERAQEEERMAFTNEETNKRKRSKMGAIFVEAQRLGWTDKKIAEFLGVEDVVIQRWRNNENVGIAEERVDTALQLMREERSPPVAAPVVQTPPAVEARAPAPGRAAGLTLRLATPIVEATVLLDVTTLADTDLLELQRAVGEEFLRRARR